MLILHQKARICLLENLTNHLAEIRLFAEVNLGLDSPDLSPVLVQGASQLNSNHVRAVEYRVLID